jgi:hypothetical protein
MIEWQIGVEFILNKNMIEWQIGVEFILNKNVRAKCYSIFNLLSLFQHYVNNTIL